MHFRDPPRRRPAASKASTGAISSNGDEAAIPTGDTLDFVDLATGALSRSEGGSAGQVLTVAFTPDGKTAVAVDDQRRVTIWHPGQPQPIETFLGHAGNIDDIAISADGSTVFTTSLDGAIFEWDLGQNRRFGKAFDLGRPTTENVTLRAGPPLAIEPHTGLLAASLNTNGRVSILSPRTFSVLKSFAASAARGANVDAVATSPAGTQLAVAWSVPTNGPNPIAHGFVDVWNVSGTSRLVRHLAGLGGSVNALAWSPDGAQVAAVGTLASGSGQLVIWDAQNRKTVANIRRKAAGYSVAFSPRRPSACQQLGRRRPRHDFWPERRFGRSRYSAATRAGRVLAHRNARDRLERGHRAALERPDRPRVRAHRLQLPPERTGSGHLLQ